MKAVAAPVKLFDKVSAVLSIFLTKRKPSYFVNFDDFCPGHTKAWFQEWNEDRSC
jgi:hypothetical protein